MNTSTATTAHNNNANNTATAEKPWRGIFLRGPEYVKTNTGKEVAMWSVYQGDDKGNPAGRVYEVKDYMRAQRLAENMSHDRELELFNESAEMAA